MYGIYNYHKSVPHLFICGLTSEMIKLVATHLANVSTYQIKFNPSRYSTFYETCVVAKSIHSVTCGSKAVEIFELKAELVLNPTTEVVL